MFGQIQAAIIEMINQNSAGLKVNPQWVYTYEPTQPEGYPAISVVPLRGTGRFADTQRFDRPKVFRVRCYQERQTVGSQADLSTQSEAERIMINLVDNLSAMFDSYSNYNLDNQVSNLVFTEPVTQDWGYSKAPNVDLRICDILVTSRVVQ